METARRRRKDHELVNQMSGRNADTADLSEARLPHDEIARRAYEFYELRGREDGHDWDDWLRAERELRETGRHEDRRQTVVEDESRYATV